MNLRAYLLKTGILFFFLSLSVFSTPISFASDDTWEWTIPTKGSMNVASDTSGKTDVYTVVINEVYANPDTSAGEKEYLELYNYGSDPVLLKDWSLTNKNGSTFIIKDEVTIGAKSYVLLEKSVSMNNNGDTITLKSQDGTERDSVEYAKTDLTKGKSLSRFCDVYELLFCSLESTQKTPGAANLKDTIEVSIDHVDGSYPLGTKIVLSSTPPDAQIYYSLDGNNPDPESQSLYKQPLVLEDDMDLLFYAIVEGRSSKIEEAHFRVERGIQKVKNYGAKINEVYLGSGSTLDNSSWLELTSIASKKIDLSGWILSTDKEGKCAAKESCIKFDFQTSLYPKSYKTLSLPLPMQSAQVFYLLDKEKNIADEVHLYSFDAGQSFARYNSAQRNFTTREIPALYAITDFPTKGKENIIAHTYADDKDGDLLNTHDEEFFGTSPVKFDTNKNGFPDFYDKGKELTGGFQKYFYKKLLADLVEIHAVDGKLLGRTLPSAEISIYTLDDTKVGDTTSDLLGNFSWELPEVLKDKILYATVTDRSGVESFPTESFMAGVSGTDQQIAATYTLRIAALMPNPEGTDSKAAEWIEIKNSGSSTVDLQGLIVSINDKDTVIKNSILIQAGETKRLSGEEIGKSISNSGTLQLKTSDGTVLDTLTYTDPGAGEVVSPAVKEGVQTSAVSSSATKKTAVKTVAKILTATPAKKSAIPSVAKEAVASLEEIATSDAPALPVGYTLNPNVQGDVLPSEDFANTHPVEQEKNIVLALLGGFMTTMSGFVFWKF